MVLDGPQIPVLVLMWWGREEVRDRLVGAKGEQQAEREREERFPHSRDHSLRIGCSWELLPESRLPPGDTRQPDRNGDGQRHADYRDHARSGSNHT